MPALFKTASANYCANKYVRPFPDFKFSARAIEIKEFFPLLQKPEKKGNKRRIPRFFLRRKIRR